MILSSDEDEEICKPSKRQVSDSDSDKSSSSSASSCAKSTTSSTKVTKKKITILNSSDDAESPKKSKKSVKKEKKTKKKKEKKEKRNRDADEDAEDDGDEYFKGGGASDDSDFEGENYTDDQKEAILEMFNEAPLEDIQSMINISKLKMKHIIELRPFKDFLDLVSSHESFN